MRAAVGLMLAGSLFISNALAASHTGPLAPGKPAGVKQADIEQGGVLLVIGVLGLATGIALIASGTDSDTPSTPATIVTPTTTTS